MAVQPLGYEINGGGWGESLLLPPSPAQDSAFFLYRHVFKKVRFMGKLVEYYEHPDRWRSVMDMVRVARTLDLDIVFCIDGHNIARNKGEYHQSRFEPPEPMRVAVRRILGEVGLTRHDVLEVDNEAHYLKRRRGLKVREYRDQRAVPYVTGAGNAGFRGQIWGEQTGEWFRDFNTAEWADYWEKNVTWPHTLGEYRHSWVLDPRPADPFAFKQAILDRYDNPHRPNNPWVGWENSMTEDEFSCAGKQVHCNSRLAYDMQTAACQAFRQLKVPFGHLTMGGTDEDWPTPGGPGWGMSTILTKRDGAFSMIARALADDAGVTLPDAGNGNGSGGGSEPDGFRESIRYLQRVNKLLEEGESVAEIRDDGQSKRRYKRWMEKI